MTTYFDHCVQTYDSTLNALREAGLRVEFADTGGSCYGIFITGIEDRDFADGMYILLTAGGPLTEERDPLYDWDIGLYDDPEEFGTVGVMCVGDPHPKDRAEDDAALAALVGRVARTLRRKPVS